MACTKYDDADQAALVKGYLNYVISADGPGGRGAERRLGADLATRLRPKIQPAVDAIGTLIGSSARAAACGCPRPRGRRCRADART